MQALGTKRVVTAPVTKKMSGGMSNEKAACKLSFYTDYPKDAIAIDDFEQYAIDRLQGNVVISIFFDDRIFFLFVI